ncbi:hypothetical protein O181_098744 [Austropuccinia psidii MF-1]|uniref:Uncharacterized protein n=1 Tax=Austropuccinia psidii MF-1 TaxID=1389203 RepID=A0A9Q3JBU9_9BASI|nr:hypothetical protein [Austropuccinia psidii MF-1]
MELCDSTQIEEWRVKHISNIRIFQELPQESSRTYNTQVSIKPNPEIPIKHSKAELTSNDFQISNINNVHLNYPQTSENTYSSNMEASIPIEMELVQNEGLKTKQLVNSVSPVCGKSGCHIIKEQKPLSEFYKPFLEAIFSKPTHSISPMELLRVTSGAQIKFTLNLFNKFKNKKMQKKFKEDFPVENQKLKNEEISSYLPYMNSRQEETHQMKNHQSSPSLEDYIPSGKTSSLIEDQPSPHKEQKIKIKDQLFSNLNYFIIQKEDKIKEISENQEFNTKNENMTQVEEFNSPIYVRVEWEEYPVMAIMNPNIEENVLPLEIGLSIGMKPKMKNKSKHKLIMKKV